MSRPLLLAIARGVIVVLATGGMTVLTTYTQTTRWTPSLVAGGTAACAVVLSQLGVTGAIASVKALTPP